MSLNCQADELTEKPEGEELEEAQQTCGRPNVNSSEQREIRREGGREVGWKREGDNGGQIMSIFAFLK